MFYYFVPAGRIVKESDLRMAYLLTTGKDPDKNLSEFTTWGNELPSKPMKISRASDPVRLAVAGHMDVATVLYMEQHPGTSIEVARELMGQQKVDCYKLAADMADIDAMSAFSVASSNKESEFVWKLNGGIEQLYELLDWIDTVWNRLNREAYPYDAWRIMLVRDTLNQMILHAVVEQ